MSVDPSARQPYIPAAAKAKYSMLWPMGFSPVGLATARGIACPGGNPPALMQSDITFFQKYLSNPPMLYVFHFR